MHHSKQLFHTSIWNVYDECLLELCGPHCDWLGTLAKFSLDENDQFQTTSSKVVDVSFCLLGRKAFFKPLLKSKAAQAVIWRVLGLQKENLR